MLAVNSVKSIAWIHVHIMNKDKYVTHKILSEKRNVERHIPYSQVGKGALH